MPRVFRPFHEHCGYCALASGLSASALELPNNDVDLGPRLLAFQKLASAEHTALAYSSREVPGGFLQQRGNSRRQQGTSAPLDSCFPVMPSRSPRVVARVQASPADRGIRARDLTVDFRLVDAPQRLRLQHGEQQSVPLTPTQHPRRCLRPDAAVATNRHADQVTGSHVSNSSRFTKGKHTRSRVIGPVRKNTPRRESQSRTDHAMGIRNHWLAPEGLFRKEKYADLLTPGRSAPRQPGRPARSPCEAGVADQVRVSRTDRAIDHFDLARPFVQSDCSPARHINLDRRVGPLHHLRFGQRLLECTPSRTPAQGEATRVDETGTLADCA